MDTGGSSGTTTTSVAPAPAPTPPTPPTATASSQPTSSQTQTVADRLYAAQGPQSTVLTSNVNTDDGVIKKTLLGG